MAKDSKPGYNERLFGGGGIRSYFHNARFHWVQNRLRHEHQPVRSVIEIGCFDGKLLDYLPSRPNRYVGLDAGWEGGLQVALQKYSGDENVRFILGDNPRALDCLYGETFDLVVSMETLEHVPPDQVEHYLAALARLVNGNVLITVPNEKGLVFLFKWLVKKLFFKDAEKYTFKELVAATIGRMEKVSRIEHKGFDYAQFIQEVKQHFEVERMEGIPFRWLPIPLAFNIGIVAKQKKPSN